MPPLGYWASGSGCVRGLRLQRRFSRQWRNVRVAKLSTSTCELRLQLRGRAMQVSSVSVSWRPSFVYIQFVDGDCELVTGWMEEAAAFLDAKRDVAVVCGRRRERNPGAVGLQYALR